MTEGATLKCNCGVNSGQLKIIDQKRPLIKEKRQATIMDKTPLVNIPSFDHCKTRNGPCTPAIAMMWVKGKEDTQVHGVPALTEKSQIVCMTGGVISITQNGFSSSDANEASRAKHNEALRADGGMMMMIGAGAVLAGVAALAVFTAPVSVPVAVIGATTGLAMSTVAAIGTTAATGTIAAGGVTVARGGSDIYEGRRSSGRPGTIFSEKR